MLNIKKQIRKLYASSVLGNLSLTGAWVAILAARGYSLVDIGIAETVFHITSLIFDTKNQLKTIQKIEHNLAYMDYAMIFCL